MSRLAITNIDTVNVFDEFGWGDTKFEDVETAKDLIDNFAILDVSLLSVERVVCIRAWHIKMVDQVITGQVLSHWFKDSLPELLNFLSVLPEARIPIRNFLINGGFTLFSVEKYPMLAASVLGSNED